MDCTGNLLGTIGAMQFLIKNFPDNILSAINGRKTYTSIIDFITDILKSLGIEPIDIIYILLSHLTGLSEEMVKKMQDWIDIEADVDLQIEDSPGLQKIEEGVKFALSGVLSGILGCSADPLIGDKYMDAHTLLSTKGGELMVSEGGIVLNINEIDPFGFLNHCPSSEHGRNYYFDNDMGINSLYKSMDFNAFLWYALNKSLPSPQRERNKCMWDNRYAIKLPRSNNQWEEWLGSKKDLYFNKNEKYKDDARGNLICKSQPLFKPILQLTPVDTDTASIRFSISSQEYYRSRTIANVDIANEEESEEGKEDIITLGLNKTLYEFNLDYLRSIKLFSAKTFITGLIDSFMNGYNLNELQISINRVLPVETLKKIIQKGIESVSTGSETCYFTFSNDEYNDMLNHLEELKYKSKPYLNGTLSVLPVDTIKTEEIKGKLVYPDGDESLSLKEAFTELSCVTTPGKDGKLEIKLADNWLFDFVLLIIYQLIQPIFSPKILFILAVNYKMYGFDDDISLDHLLKKMLKMILSLVVTILKTILQFLIELIWTRLVKSIAMYIALRLIEMINDYIELLYLALAVCIPKFNIKLFDYKGGIDEVNHADIIPEKTTPETDKNC